MKMAQMVSALLKSSWKAEVDTMGLSFINTVSLSSNIVISYITEANTTLSIFEFFLRCKSPIYISNRCQNTTLSIEEASPEITTQDAVDGTACIMPMS